MTGPDDSAEAPAEAASAAGALGGAEAILRAYDAAAAPQELQPREADEPFFAGDDGAGGIASAADEARAARPRRRRHAADAALDEAAPQHDAHCDILRRLAELRPNDTDNGRRLMAWAGNRLLFVRGIGWHVYDGRVWDRESGQDAATRIAQRVAERIAAEAPYIAPGDLMAQIDLAEWVDDKDEDQKTGEDREAIERGQSARKLLEGLRSSRRKFSVSAGNAARIANMLEAARPHCTLDVQAMDADPYKVNCLNGTLRFYREEDLENPDETSRRYVWRCRLDPHERGDLCSRCFDAAYEPAARSPHWRALLDLFQPHAAMQGFLQLFYGYALLGLTDAQRILFHYGHGSNGKSTFIEALRQAFGGYARTLNAESIEGAHSRSPGQATPDLAELPGARLVIISELAKGEPLRETLVKQMTGGEPLMVRKNYGDFFPLKPNFTPSMSGNDKPLIRNDDDGIWRRVTLVPWTVQVMEGDPRRREQSVVLREIAEERSGLLNWLVEGALDYLNFGMSVPESVKAATQRHREDLDDVGAFVAACVKRQRPEITVQSRVLFEAYEAWCAANAIKPRSEKAFSQAMERKGFEKMKGRIMSFCGLSVDAPEDPRKTQTRNPYDA